MDLTDSLKPVVSPTENTTYSLTVITEHGCEDFRNVIVSVLDSLEILEQYSNVKLCSELPATLYFPVKGSELQFQWEKKIDVDSAWENVSGSNYENPRANPLNIRMVRAADHGVRYRLRITSPCQGIVYTDEIPVEIVESERLSVKLNSNVDVCYGHESEIYASVTGGGPNPTFKWFINGYPPEHDITDSIFTHAHLLAPGSLIVAEVTSSAACRVGPSTVRTESLAIIPVDTIKEITVTPIDAEYICEGDAFISFQANISTMSMGGFPTNAGTTAQMLYKWVSDDVEFVNDTAVIGVVRGSDLAPGYHTIGLQFESKKPCIFNPLHTIENIEFRVAARPVFTTPTPADTTACLGIGLFL